MKRIIFVLGVSTLMAATFFSSIEPALPKNAIDLNNIKIAGMGDFGVMNDSAQNAYNLAKVEEWKMLWKQSEKRFTDNKSQIDDLITNWEKAEKTYDAFFLSRIDELEMKNSELQATLEMYDQSEGNWESFKKEFTAGLDELQEAIELVKMDYQY
jgi:hypothetical protein